jgi:hypothetical protein
MRVNSVHRFCILFFIEMCLLLVHNYICSFVSFVEFDLLRTKEFEKEEK